MFLGSAKVLSEGTKIHYFLLFLTHSLPRMVFVRPTSNPCGMDRTITDFSLLPSSVSYTPNPYYLFFNVENHKFVLLR